MVRFDTDGYIDDNGKLMSKETFDNWVIDIQSENFKLKIKSLAEENTRLREALEFYAKGIHADIKFDNESIALSSDSYDLWEDQKYGRSVWKVGRKAREALKGEK
jgi:hypothetical protein